MSCLCIQLQLHCFASINKQYGHVIVPRDILIITLQKWKLPQVRIASFHRLQTLCLLERFDKWFVLPFQKNNKVDQRVGKEQSGSQEKNEVICLNKMRTSKNNKQRVQVHSLPLPPASNPDVQMKLKKLGHSFKSHI